MSAVCVRKGHVVRCPDHPHNYVKPGNLCAECGAEMEAKARRDAEEHEANKQRMEDECKDEWYRDTTKERKSGNKLTNQTTAAARAGRV